MFEERDVVIIKNSKYDLEVKYNETNSRLVVQKDFFYKDLFIPKDFSYDGCSIPSPLWSMFGKPHDKEFLVAACVHDYIYNNSSCPIKRRKADDIFYDLLVEEGNNSVKSGFMWLGVRVFGRLFWRNT